MKLVHKTSETTVEALAKARELEAEGELKEAATYYEKVLKVYSTDENIYNRLMIIYRKLREFKKELTIIDTGIKEFSELYNSGKSSNKKIATLSRALLKSTGLVNKKGEAVYEQEPIAKWKKRRVVVKKKLEK
jgi:tetratricopeptide (TPR) repeat protein